MSDYIQATNLKSIVENCNPDLVWMKLQDNMRYNERTAKLTFSGGEHTMWRTTNFGNRCQYVSQKLIPGWELMTRWSFKTMAKKTFLKY